MNALTVATVEVERTFSQTPPAFTLVEEAATAFPNRFEEVLRLIKSSLPFFSGLKKIGDILNPPPAFGRKTPRDNIMFPDRFNEQMACLWLARVQPQEDRCTHFDGICRREGEDLLLTGRGRILRWLYRYESMGNYEGRGCRRSPCTCNRPEEEGSISSFFWLEEKGLAALFRNDPSLEERVLRELQLQVQLYAIGAAKNPQRTQASILAAMSFEEQFNNLL